MNIRQQIYKVVKQSDGLTAREIARCIDRNYSTWLRNHIDGMVELGDFKKLKRRGVNGRPVYFYKLADPLRSLRAEYLAEKMRGYTWTYEMWLEDKVRELRNDRV